MSKLELTKSVTKRIKKLGEYSETAFKNDARFYIGAVARGELVIQIINSGRGFILIKSENSPINFNFYMALGYKAANRYNYLLKIKTSPLEVNMDIINALYDMGFVSPHVRVTLSLIAVIEVIG